MSVRTPHRAGRNACAIPWRRGGSMAAHAFTMIEVLVVAGITAILLSLLLPSLSHARRQAKTAQCRSNVRQVWLANDLYAQESGGVYVAGAYDIRRNLHRWHGVRERSNEPFDVARGPLVRYLGRDASIRACPAFLPTASGFERGNGGFGYNNAYLGTRVATNTFGRPFVDDRLGASSHWVAKPGETIMFADSAFAERTLIEYSFAEPRFFRLLSSRADPSIHFRHGDASNVAWSDGHVSGEVRAFTWCSGVYPADPDRLSIGWFGLADDNSLFDLQ